MNTTGPCPLGPHRSEKRQHIVALWRTPGETARLLALWEPGSNEHRLVEMESGESRKKKTGEKFTDTLLKSCQ